MKVIVNDKVYVQVRDILFIARLYGNEKIMNYYLFLINQEFLDTDFVLSNNFLLNKILKSSLILDFNEYRDYSNFHISNLIISLSSVKMDEQGISSHQIDDLRDIMNFKRGVLQYTIPLIPNGKIDEKYDDLRLRFRSTIFNEYFIIEAEKQEDICNYDYMECLKRGINMLKNKGSLLLEEPVYNLINKGNCMIVSFKKEKTKKETIINKIAKKVKKETK